MRGKLLLLSAFSFELLLSAIKIAVGWVWGFGFVLADGVHSLGDALLVLSAYLSLKFSEREPDEEHPYGYEKYETVMALIIGVSLLFMGAEVLEEGILGLLHPERVSGDPLVPSLVFLLAFLVNFSLYLWVARVFREEKADVLYAYSRDTLSDSVYSLAFIPATFLVSSGMHILNPILTVLVSIFIIRNAVDVVREATRVLTDTAVVPREEIEKVVLKHPDVRWVHAVKSRGRKGAVWIDLHIGVDPEMSVREAHDRVSHEVKLLIKKHIEGVKGVMIHIEPDTPEARERKRSVFRT